MRGWPVETLVTTAFEVLAVLLIAAAVGVALWAAHPAAALAGTGIVLIILSAVIQWRGAR